MAFPNIVTDRPVGTQMVSTIDDFERETRTWLRQCMAEISGYPDVNTVGVKGWTNSTRPSSNPNSNYLVGFNTQTGQLEVIGQDGTVYEPINKQELILLAYPVGSYYWTSDTSFNPNTSWGGTWVRIQDGTCLICNKNKTNFHVGDTGGAEEVSLTTDQLAEHYHKHTHPHSHEAGTLKITGSFPSAGSSTNKDKGERPTYEGAFYCKEEKAGVPVDFEGTKGDQIGFDSSRSGAMVGTTKQDKTANVDGYTGKSKAHTNMQPYRVAALWHRTA